jgi:cell division protein FtsL
MKRKKRKARNPKILAAWLAFMGLFIAELLFYTWSRVQCIQVRYEISEITANLKIELARLKAPRRISKIAKEQLGLVAPTSKQHIILP